MQKRFSFIVLQIVFFIGLSLLLYPPVSNCWNSFHQTRAIAQYSGEVASLKPADYKALWSDAQAYNASLLGRSNQFLLSEAQKEEYSRLLNLSGLGIMGYIDIPAINCRLPIYHGTEESVLQIAVGHLEWSSLPVGGESTHCVLSGHRGLPSARLFTDLDQLKEGDIFILRVLDEELRYCVDQILTVVPQETEALRIAPGEDYCTLVTCTPYGINTHRLLVRGHRVSGTGQTEALPISADAEKIRPLMAAAMAATPILLLSIISLLAGKLKRKRRGDQHEEA